MGHLGSIILFYLVVCWTFFTFHVCVLHFEAKPIRDWRIAISENTLSIAFRSKNRIGKLQLFSSGAVVYILVFSFIFRRFGVTTSKEIILRRYHLFQNGVPRTSLFFLGPRRSNFNFWNATTDVKKSVGKFCFISVDIF